LEIRSSPFNRSNRIKDLFRDDIDLKPKERSAFKKLSVEKEIRIPSISHFTIDFCELMQVHHPWRVELDHIIAERKKRTSEVLEGNFYLHYHHTRWLSDM
jgi:hypothetical protein